MTAISPQRECCSSAPLISAEAALALGSTYDPNVIKRLGAIMVKPDVENALPPTVA
jgi:hypothetical protein